MTIDTVEINFSFDFYCSLKEYKEDFFDLLDRSKLHGILIRKLKNVLSIMIFFHRV